MVLECIYTVSLYLLYFNSYYSFIFPDTGIPTSVSILDNICCYLLSGYYLPELPPNCYSEHYTSPTVLLTAACNGFTPLHWCQIPHLVWSFQSRHSILE